MMRFIMPIILIGISIAVFLTFTNPMYGDMGAQRAQLASYNGALDNSKALYEQRDLLTQKESAIDPVNLAKLEKLLPENVDNIRLILEIEQIAAPYNMVLKDIKYNATTSNTTTAGAVAAPSAVDSGKDYGVWDLEFSTVGTYTNFLSFTKDLEKNLRIVDVASIQFSSSTSGASGLNPTLAESYKYDFKIKTYWLKN